MRWRAALLALVLAMPAGASADVPIEYATRVAPRFPGARALGPLAVAGFTGAADRPGEGKEFTAALRAELQAASVDDKAYYTIRNLDEAIKTDTLATALKAGATAGVAGVFFGAVGSASIVPTDYKQDQANCTKSSIVGCSNKVTTKIDCKRYTGTYVVTPALYVVADGKLFYTETVTEHGEFSTCDEVVKPTGLSKLWADMNASLKKDEPVTSPEQLLIKLRTQAAAEIRTHLTPTTKKIKVTFKDTARELARADQDAFKSAAAFARANRLERACGIFDQLDTPDKAKSVALQYNLGVCQEALEPDRPGDALVYYNKAEQLTTTPDRLVSEAIQRMQALRDSMPAAKH